MFLGVSILGMDIRYLDLLELDDLETSLYYLGTKGKSGNF
tara:strand:+ start:1462 stop:1581 length:120 start_codon:yes stop_codon:yes gene_type:complete